MIPDADKRMADERCRAYVMTRDRYQCQLCKLRATEWCHVYSRGIPSLCWAPDNSFAACRTCHTRLDSNRKALRRWWRRKLGPTRFMDISELGRTKSGKEWIEHWRNFKP